MTRTLDHGGVVALSAIPLGHLGQHRVVGGQVGVVVAVGGPVEPLGGALIAARHWTSSAIITSTSGTSPAAQAIPPPSR